MEILNRKIVNENKTYFEIKDFEEIDTKALIKFFLAFAYSESKDIEYLVERDNTSFILDGHQIDNLIFRGK